jgi:hypothetical protein
MSQVKGAKCASWSHELDLWLQCKEEFMWGMEGNHQQKYQFTSGLNCFDQTVCICTGKYLGR